ncbi:MAG TPA: isochorismatase family protein [Candidatus Methylomirabilis sp.]|jgi:ureidoacrylate peracid hydrolase
MRELLTIPARPEPLSIQPAQTAVIVVDMQNAFVSRGGYLDLFGADVSGAPDVVRHIQRVLAASRPAGMQVVYLQMGWEHDLCDAGGPASPNWHKANALRLMRQRPELQGKLMIKGTWDYALVDDLKPQPQDLVVHKPRYSGFSGTNLDMLLRARGIRNLIFTGIATNVCVESTLRDAFFLEYFPLLVTDSAMAAGPPALHEATVYNVQRFFGWVATTDEYVGALQGAA